MFVPDALIETERLIMRTPVRADFDAYAAMYEDEETARFIGGQMSRAAAWRKFLVMAGAWTMQGFAMFMLIERSSGRFVGQLGPWQPEGWPGTEIGWSLVREFWGRGYATEAAASATDWAFANLGWSEIIHCIDPDNVASQRVARQLGSSLLRRTNMPSPFEEIVVDVWGQSREEWFARKAGAAA